MNTTRLKAERIETLGDGVFAIGMTLLVLDLKVPPTGQISSNQELLNYFVQLAVPFGSFLLSFIQLAIVWVTHHTQFSYINKTSREMTWINIFLFLTVTLLPFTTAMLSRFPSVKLVVALYWFNNVLGVGLLYVNWLYVLKHKYYYQAEHVEQIVKIMQVRLRNALVLFMAGFLASFLISSKYSFILIVLIDLVFILPTRFDKKFRKLLTQ